MTGETVICQRVFFLPNDVFRTFPTLIFDVELISLILGVRRIRNYGEWLSNSEIPRHSL